MSEKCEAMSFCPVYKIYAHLSSSEAGRHLLNARKEILLAVKSLIEKEVERMERMKVKKSDKAKKVKIS